MAAARSVESDCVILYSVHVCTYARMYVWTMDTGVGWMDGGGWPGRAGRAGQAGAGRAELSRNEGGREREMTLKCVVI